MTVSNCSYLRFLYPFGFNEKLEDLIQRLENDKLARKDSKNKDSDKEAHSVWQPVAFSSSDLLPHVAEYVNGDRQEQAAPRGVWYEMADAVREAPRGLGFRRGITWTLNLGDRRVEFVISSVEICLFRLGIGFLIFEVRLVENPETRADSFADFQRLLYHLRYLEDSRGADVGITRAVRSKGDSGEWEERVEDFRPGFLEDAEDTKDKKDKKLHLGTLQKALMSRLGSKDETCWWQDAYVRGRTISYSVVFLDAVREQDVARTLYQIRRAFPTDRVIRPSAKDLDLTSDDLLCYAEDQWFSFSLDSSAFAAFDAPEHEFFRTVLPQHLRRQYFIPFLLALHQRFVLSSLSSQVATQWLTTLEPVDTSDPEDAKQLFEKRKVFFEKIQLSLLDFTARGYFRQVMHLHNHHQAYRRWQEVFLVHELYQEVRDEVREMHEYLMARHSEQLAEIARRQEVAEKKAAEEELKRREEDEASRLLELEAEEKRAKKLESLVTALGFIFGIPALWLSFLGVNLKGFTSGDEGLTVGQGLGYLIASLVVGAVFYWAVQYAANSPEEQGAIKKEPVTDKAKSELDDASQGEPVSDSGPGDSKAEEAKSKGSEG